MEIITTNASGTGRVYYRAAATDTSYTVLTTPTGVTSSDANACIIPYKTDTYIVGAFSNPLRVTNISGTMGLWKVGLTAPSAPTLAANTGATGITGSAIGYCSYVHKSGSTDIAESDLSAATSTVTLTDDGRSWTNIPTTSTDTRVTHVRLYCSMDGALPRKVADVTLGTSSHNEAVTTATLANNYAAPSTSTGDLDTNARGIPPTDAIFAVIWHDRMWYVSNRSTKVYYSRLFEPEAVSASSYIETTGGEFITALIPLDDELVIFHKTGAYVLSGYGLSDFAMRKTSLETGCISHWSCVNASGTAIFASPQGICGYNTGGSSRNLMARSVRSTYMTHYIANASSYYRSIGTLDGYGNYLLTVPRDSEPKTWIWVGYLRAMTEENQLEPYWSIDKRNRKDTAVLSTHDSNGVPTLSFVGSDGYTRKEDDTDDDDDSDTFSKALTIKTPHFIFGDQTGSLNHGRSFKQLEPFIVNPNDDVTVKLWVGDDDAPSAAAASSSKTLSAVSDTSYVKKSAHLIPIHASGKGITLQYEVTSPTEFEYRGQAIFVEQTGIDNRPAK